MNDSQAVIPAIRIEGAAIVRGERLVLRDFSLAVESGEIVWVRGANGTGKTTLFRAIAALLPLSAGRMAVQGRLALCDDNNALDADETLERNVRFWSRLDGSTSVAVEQALTALDLVPLAELPVRYLSAGQKKRGSLARVIAGGAAIWLLDEPYNGLDQANVTRLDSALQRHAANGGIAIIASHIAPSVNVAQSVTLDRAARQVSA